MIFSPYTNETQLKYHSNWFILRNHQNINESSNIFKIGYGRSKSTYNKSIEKIAKNIVNDHNSYDICLYKDDDSIYKCFEVVLPFVDVPMVNIISKLKIYVKLLIKKDNTDDNIFVIASNLHPEYESEFNPEVLPLFKSVGTTVLVLTIVMELNKIDLEIITAALYHEFRHALDYIADKKLVDLSNKLNYSVEMFGLLAYDKNRNDPLKYIYEFLRDCAYYTQDTEIKGHLDNAYYELECSNFLRDDVLDLCKILTYTYNISYGRQIRIYNALPTLYNYLRILWQLQGIMQVKDNVSNLIFDEKISKQILDIVYHESVLERPFKNSIMNLLKKWERQLMKFIKQFTKAVYLHYQINEDYSL